MSPTEEELNNKVRDKIDSYKDTVMALLGFLNFFKYDADTDSLRADVRIGQGRRMLTSKENKTSPNNEVTPDLCILLNDD